MLISTLSPAHLQDIAWFDQPENSSGTIAGRLATDTLHIRGAVGDVLGLISQNIVTVLAAFVSLHSPLSSALGASPKLLHTYPSQGTTLCRSCMPVTALKMVPKAGCPKHPAVHTSLHPHLHCHSLPQLPAGPTAAAPASGSQVLRPQTVAMCGLLQIIAFTAGWRMTLVVLATLPLTVAAYGVQSRFLIGFSAKVSLPCSSCSHHAAGPCCWTPV